MHELSDWQIWLAVIGFGSIIAFAILGLVSLALHSILRAFGDSILAAIFRGL